MEIIKKKINKKSLNNKDISKDVCFFDIETTGFNRNNDIVYLIGILYFDKKENSWVIAQYFANDLKDEPQLLLESSKFLMNFETIINYNGNTFDIPFVNHKLRYFGFPYSIKRENSLDIYSILRKNKSFLEIENLKLKTVEKYLGIYREDIYSGKDCISFYNDYILGGELELKERLLSHNFEDLYFLIDIMNILNIIKEKKSFKVKKDENILDFFITDIKESKDTMTFKGQLNGIKEKFIHYDRNFNILIENKDKFEIIIYTNKGLVTPDKTCIFVDKSDFNLPKNIRYSHEYEIPQNLFLLKISSDYLLNDILIFLKEILQNIL
ncbi:MAG: ribonuclease H-like domain-containing protein [Tissierella sp.]|uniref:ribonuclease H-like domain-containing protein n=1 Tax=Tissierella sp. TaxID=41274 RepID=UPI003F9E9361